MYNPNDPIMLNHLTKACGNEIKFVEVNAHCPNDQIYITGKNTVIMNHRTFQDIWNKLEKTQTFFQDLVFLIEKLKEENDDGR